MAYSDFDKLKAFFFELKNTNFHPERMRSRFAMNGAWVTVDKAECFDLLRKKIPDLKGKDDAYLVKYLSNPNNIQNRVLAEFTAEERIELERSLAEQPVATEGIEAQPSGQGATTEQIPPASTAPGIPAGEMPWIPSVPTVRLPRFTRNIPHTPAPPPLKSDLVATSSSGVIKEAPSGAKLVTASSSGAIKEAPPKQVFIANKSGEVTGIHNIKPPSTPSWLKTFGSNLQIFTSRNLGKLWDGLKGMVGGIGRGITGPGLTKVASLGGRASLGFINHGGNFLNNLSDTRSRLSAASRSVSPKNLGSKKALIILLGIFFLIPLFQGLTGNTPGGQAGPLPSPSPPGGGGGDIGSCTFYRDDQNPPGLKFRITEWPALINEVATKVGVPASVIAAILRVESGTSFYTNDPSYITNDYDATTNGLVYGVMQFYPPTFEGIFNRHQSELTQLFGKTSVTIQIVPQDQMAPPNVFRIYSVRDQIIAAAFKIKDDAGTNPPYDKQAIEKIVIAYFTQCTYTSGGNTYNYCDAVWNSYTRCSVPSGNLASCPLAGQRTITCGSYGSDHIYNASFCDGPAPEDRGHCGRTYGSNRCSPDSRRAHAIDVTATPGETVYLPTIEGKPVTWRHLGQYSISPADGGGFGHYFSATLGQDSWTLHLIHTNADLIGFSGGKDHYESGDPVTTIAATSFPHVHVNIGKNPDNPDSGAGWLNPEDLGMCTK